MPLKNEMDLQIRRMLKAAGVRSYDLSVIFLTGSQMRSLNRKSLGHDYITDVITFDLKDYSVDLPQKSKKCACKALIGIQGEIYICAAEARRNARMYGEPFQRELLRYIAHGILHLLGYDDSTKDQRAVMREQEDRLLTI